MKNTYEYTFDRETIEAHAGRPITDKEWEVMAEEIADALDYYFGEEVPRLWNDIDELVSDAE